MKTTRWTVLAAVTGVVCALLTATPQAIAGTDQVPTPVLSWTDCADGFQCSTAGVPLDYDQPAGTQTSLALIKLPATDQAHRIGTLFVNFGGPGASGLQRLRERGQWTWLFSAELRARFDLVSWDPRGIGASATVRCFDSVAEQQAFLGGLRDFPATAADEPAFYAGYDELARRCSEKSGSLLEHVSTANTARDLDLLRRAVGDAKLTYHGISYGTHLGAVYANLYPNRVRAMAFDGSMDFEGNATGHGNQGATVPLDTRQDVPRGAAETFASFLRQCAAPGADCAFAGGDLNAKWASLVARVKAAPITVNGETYDYVALIARVNGDLATPEVWKDTASTLQALYTAPAARTLVAGEPYTSNRTEAFNAIQCADSTFPRTRSVYTQYGASEDQRVPYWGRIAVFDMMACATWRRADADRYTGPWNKVTSATILVINNRYDPSTPLHGALDGAAELARTRVLTVEGSGHSTMLVHSACAERAKREYLISGTLPAVGTTCGIDHAPFAA
ncbi:alpha/beta fold hydrolase [Umezawaea sp. Da 62-37]|uniref:alpha/beta hydrolase n=1 Tax=Umezawaea sp. Da 62-37 TaxID=3075927 RepID=UPI0028F73239|nr:alpha/beta fold hydrolase [Umezawaea sp. Da 62-37]WNV86411.1 alpha/beta fold hydrolase [Umezawaea sp. Da 62-37]